MLISYIITVFCRVCYTHIFGPNFQEKKFRFNFLIQCFIHLYLDTCFLYYKGILAFILNVLWYKKFYITDHYKTQEQMQGIPGTTHV